MPKGTRYIVGGTLGLYLNAADAVNRNNQRSTITNTSSSVEGTGEPYINNFSGWESYHPAIPIWWMPYWGGGGYEIGWVNDNDNYQATQPTISPTSVDMGSPITISTAANHPDIRHDITYTFGSKKNIAIGANRTLTTTWTPPLSLASEIPNAASGTGIITVVSRGGGRVVGTKTISFTLKVPTSIVPTITSHTITEAGATPIAWGIYVQSKTRFKVVTVSGGTYGSTITSTKTTVETKDYLGNTITTEAIKGSGNIVVKTVVTDTRGRTVTETETLTVLAYNPPEITSFRVDRCNSDGTLNKRGEYAKAVIKGKYTSLSGKNSNALKISSKTRNISSYTLQTTEGVDPDFTSIQILPAIYDTTLSYDFRTYLNDSFHSEYSNIVIGTAQILMHLGKEKIGIGKYPEQGILDIAGGVFLNSSPVITEANNGLLSGVEIISGGVDVTISKDVVFPKPFSNKPQIVFGIVSGTPDRAVVSTTYVSTSGFRINLKKTVAGDISVMWLARGG